MKKRIVLTGVLSVSISCTFLFAMGNAERTAASQGGQGRTFSISPPAEMTACLGDTITVPILLSQPDIPISAFLLSLTYPQDLLDYVDIDVTGTLLQDWLLVDAYEPDPGVIRVAGVDLDSTVTGGTFFSVIFRVEDGISGQGLICLSDFTDDLATAQTSCGTITTRDCSPTAVEEDDSRGALPESCTLMQNSPNPFNPTTAVNYQIPMTKSQRTVHVTLKIYNILGQEVAILVDEAQGSGYYMVIWDASGMPSGVYFCRLVAGDFSTARPMLLMQ